MHMIVVGMNYRTASVELREQFSVTANELPAALNTLTRHTMSECVLLSTCNRTEIYAIVDDLNAYEQDIYAFIDEWYGVSEADSKAYLYKYEDRAAREHLFRVASGLDSMVIGETQILGQVKDAFFAAQNHGATGTVFNRLFKQVITMAKRAHNETAIGENAVSVSYAAVELGKRIFGDFHGKTVTIIGAGKMSELTVKHIHEHGAERVYVINRTLQKAQELAGKFAGIPAPWEQLYELLADTDIVISSTGSQGYVLAKQQVEGVLKKRKSKPLFFIDIAVPRDLDPDIGDLTNVYCYDIDDLECIVESNIAERKIEAEKIAVMIEQELDIFEKWMQTSGVTPVIRALQSKADQIHEHTLESLFNKLSDLDEREKKLIRKLSKSMMNQLLRDPIKQVKDKAAQRGGDTAVEMFSDMFALQEHIVEQQEQLQAEQKRASRTKKEALELPHAVRVREAVTPS